MSAVTKAALGHFVQGVFLAPALHHDPVHGRHQARAVRTMFAVHQHRPLGFGCLDRTKGFEYIRVIHMVGAIGQLYLCDTRRRQPA
ncbi:hypothetical protein D3C84_933990 [compost metagenome]